MWKPITFEKVDGKTRVVFHRWRRRAAQRDAAASSSDAAAQPMAAASKDAPAEPKQPAGAPPAAQPQADAKKARRASPPEHGLLHKLFHRKKERRSSLYTRRQLERFLAKAGLETTPQRVQRVIFFTTLISVGLFTFASYIYGAVQGASPKNLLIFYSALWLVAFWGVYLFFLMCVYVYLDLKIYRRTQELEEVLPDFLQLASANISAGMPIDRALWLAVRPNFGVLAKEIEEVARATLAGEELDQSLMQFVERYDSNVLRRSISILLEGLAAGGEIAGLLDKIALNIQETRIMRKEMAASVMTYAIFITFASIVMAPFLFALGTQLLTIIVGITSTLDLSGATNSFMSIDFSNSQESIGNFKKFSYLMLSITALMSAMLVSTIRKGRVRDGLHMIPIFIAVSLSLYTLGVWIFDKLLGGLF